MSGERVELTVASAVPRLECARSLAYARGSRSGDPPSARELIGASALGVALAPEIDALETGVDSRVKTRSPAESH